MKTMQASEQPAVDRWIGKTLDGRYRLEQRLGASAIGSILRARDRARRRAVTVTVLHDELASASGTTTAFLEEAKALSRIRHASVVKVEDFGRIDQTAYAVTEWVEGPTLEQWARPLVPLTWVRARPIAIQVAKAVQAIHRRRLLHGDLRLHSCLVCDADRVPPALVVGGFGFVASRRVFEPQLAVSEATDLQAIGMLLVSLLTRGGLQLGSLEEARARPLPGLPAAVVAVVHRALLDAEDGFASIQELLAALEDPMACAGRSSSPRPAQAPPVAPLASWPSPSPSFPPCGPPPLAVPPEPEPAPLPMPPLSMAAWMARQPNPAPMPTAPAPLGVVVANSPLASPPPAPAPTTVLERDEVLGGAGTTVFDRRMVPTPSPRAAPIPLAPRGPQGTVQLDPRVLAALRGEDVEPTSLVTAARVAAATTTGPIVAATPSVTTAPMIEPTECLPPPVRHDLVRPPSPPALPPLSAPPPRVATAPAPAAIPVPETQLEPPISVAPTASIPTRSPNVVGLLIVGLAAAVALGALVGLLIARSHSRVEPSPAPTTDTHGARR